MCWGRVATPSATPNLWARAAGSSLCQREGAGEGGGGWGTKPRKQAAISTCNFIWYAIAEAIIVFVELKSEGR